jgi:acyl-coenzyme A synthetase/AMP-(fatty) acid ligase
VAVAANLAQVYYTSGSTGKPKGILLSHEGWANIIAWHARYFGITPADRAAQFGAVAFDACAWELWTNLAAGASVHIMDEEVRMSPEAALAWMADEGITATWLPAVLAEAVLDLPLPPGLRLRWLASGGDRLRHRPGRELPFTFHNMYGPTEITIMRTCGPVGPDAGSLPPIGHPISNTELYVLDRHANPVPIDVPGELYIGGVGLARGYLGRPGQTAERFVPNPFSSAPGSRLYRTGDVVRLLEDGAVDFIGRTDHQVKLRGFRVELGEIEAALARHTQVAECAVVARPGPNGAPRVVAYAVTTAAPGALREDLARQLPDYMVPSAFVLLEAMPVNSFGKIDRLALPDPEDAEERTAPVEPRTETECALVAVWREVLGSETIGVHDDFFNAGGTSLLATRVSARIRAELGRPMPLRRLFEHSTVARLAAWLDANPAG